MKELIGHMDFTQGRHGYFRDLLEALMKKAPGNIVEIGGGMAENTTLFCEIAQRYKKQVLVIDPFEEGWDNMPLSYQYSYEKFKRNTQGYGNLTVHKFPSNHPSCVEKIKLFAPIAFCFIDALQYKDAVLSDMALMEQFTPSIMCLDDANRLTGESEVPLALKEYKGKYKLIKQGREAYLCL